MAYSYQQIIDATPESLQADPGLMKAAKSIYGGNLDDATFLSRLSQPAGQYGSGKDYIVGQLSLTPGAELNHNFDRYINWNNPNNPQDQVAANSEREKGLKALAEYEAKYAAFGLDPNSIPFIQQMKQGFGATPGGGQTSAQTAEQINKEKASAVQTPADQWKPVDNPKMTDPAAQQPAASNISPATMAKPGIANLVTSGKVFNDIDAKNFAFANGDQNWQQYVGGSGGQANPNYISATNWATLQKQYTPYQLQQATVRTANGIYWNPNVNIGSVSRVDPMEQINSDTKSLANIVTDAKATADKFSSDAAKKSEPAPKSTDDTATSESAIMSMLTDKFGVTAEKLYNELFNTPEMKTAKAEVNKYKTQLDEYDQQLEDLKDDIRSEVEGEASDSYVTALAVVRGEKILKNKRATQRDYDTALANYNALKENATNLMEVRSKDADTRYNRLFSMLQLQIQQEGTAFNQNMAMAQLALQMPEGREMTIGGQTVKGLKENDNLNIVQFTDAAGKTYVIGVDKKTGQQTYKTYIGQSSTGAGKSSPTVTYDEALYWLSFSKDKDGNVDMSKIPAEYRPGVINTITANKDKFGDLAPKRNWWEVLGDAINPFDGK